MKRKNLSLRGANGDVAISSAGVHSSTSLANARGRKIATSPLAPRNDRKEGKKKKMSPMQIVKTRERNVTHNKTAKST